MMKKILVILFLFVYVNLYINSQNQTINGNLSVSGTINTKGVDCTDTSLNKLKSVLARIPEGNTIGEGTYLGVKSYYSQTAEGVSTDKVKSFSIEHKFYGSLNSSINFHRGGSYTGGFITFSVHNGTHLCKFSSGLVDVAGTVRAREVKVEVTAGADHVFKPEYNLKPLNEVETFIQENNHLPEIPSEKQMQQEGLNVNEFQIRLLQKIEELTLYVIAQDKEIKELKKQLKEK